jgi:hypothetical protein
MIPKKPASGLDPGVGTDFWTRPCSNKKLEPGCDSIKTDRALGNAYQCIVFENVQGEIKRWLHDQRLGP